MGRADLEQNLQPLRALPFVRGVRLIPATDRVSGGLLEIRSAPGVFKFTVEFKGNYLDRALVGSILALDKRLEKQGEPRLLLLARHVSRPAGERLAEAGVSFSDRSGNVNIRLGDQYQALLLGRPDTSRKTRARKLSPAAVQVLFTALARPDLLGGTVRKLADVAGVGKSTMADVRQQLVEERILVAAKDGGYHVAGERVVRERFVVGYSQVLRPHLLIGRYRGPYRRPDDFVEKLQRVGAQRSVVWALSGTAGAYELDRFYRGPETVAFIDRWTADLGKDLRLVADSNGPITLLKSFGTLLVWPRLAGRPVAHPWMVYAELLHNGEPRALEDAEELRENHLK